MTRLAFAASIALLALCLPVSAQVPRHPWALGASYSNGSHEMNILMYAENSCNPAADPYRCCRVMLLVDHALDESQGQLMCSEFLLYGNFRSHNAGTPVITEDLLERFARDVLEGHFVEHFGRPIRRLAVARLRR